MHQKMQQSQKGDITQHHLPLSSDIQHLNYGVCLEVRGEIIRTVLCCVVYDSSAQLCLSVCILCFCFSYCIYVVLLSAQWGGSNGIEAWSLGLLFLQCFDTIGWVF